MRWSRARWAWARRIALTRRARLLLLLEERQGPPAVPIYVNTGRATQAALAADGRLERARDRGVVVVSDTCTYLTPILERLDGAVMTNSGKWAHYAPGNLGVGVAFGELEDCVASAYSARVQRRV